VGLSGGLLLGVVYLGLLYWMRVEITQEGHDVTIPIAVFFAVNFAVMGYLVGGQTAARARAGEEARRARHMMLVQEAEHAHDIQAARLAALGRLAQSIASDLDPRIEALSKVESPETLEPLRTWSRALHDYGRPIDAELQVVDVGALVGRAISRAGDVLGSCQLHLDERPPEVARQFRADPLLLEPVFEEIFRNAGEILHGQGEIHVRAGVSAGYAWVEVADDGPGVPLDLQAHLFEPFGSARPNRAGLGLATAARVVEALGGRLSLQPGRGLGDAGRGACFRVALPAHGAQAKAARGPS